MPLFNRVDQRREINHFGAAEQNQTAALGHARDQVGIYKMLVLSRDRGQHEDHIGAVEYIF